MSKVKDEEKSAVFTGGSEFDAGESGMLPHTPFQNNPDVADQVRGDPRIDGPYLDDVRRAQEDASRSIKEAEAKKFVDEKRKEAEAKLKASENKSEKKTGAVKAEDVVHPAVKKEAPVKKAPAKKA